MTHLTVTVVLFLLACAYVAPAPKPDKAKISFVKDSNLGLAAAGDKGKANGIVDTSKGFETVEVPVDTGDKVPDVTVLDNINAGAAFAANGSVANAVTKNRVVDDQTPAAKDPIKSAVPFFGW